VTKEGSWRYPFFPIFSLAGVVSQTLFQTLPGPAVQALHVVKDRVFVASGPEVSGFSKKGKRFYQITTLLTENVQQLYVSRAWAKQTVNNTLVFPCQTALCTMPICMFAAQCHTAATLTTR
jgi:hypothetical protein